MRVIGLELQILQRGLRRGKSFFVQLAATGAHGLVRGIVFGGGFSIGGEFLDAQGAAIGVERPRREIQIFLFRERVEDLDRRQGGRRFRVRYADDAFYFVFGGRRL